jgi:hypothetical protein
LIDLFGSGANRERPREIAVKWQRAASRGENRGPDLGNGLAVPANWVISATGSPERQEQVVFNPKGKIRMEYEQTERPSPGKAALTIMSIGTVTLATHDMSPAMRFYPALGFALHGGGEDASFTSFHASRCHLSLLAQPPSRQWSWWDASSFTSQT